MSRRFTPVDPRQLVAGLAERCADVRPEGVATRVLIDGPPIAAPASLGAAVAELLRSRGRPSEVIHADTFWRDASVRLEFGHQDVDEYLRWLDADALVREVLEPLGPGGRGAYLASLRDPGTNRATRAPLHTAEPGTIVLICGHFLLGRALPHELAVHLAVSPAARARSATPQDAWTLPAFDHYDTEADPITAADIVVRSDDPEHPAVAW